LDPIYRSAGATPIFFAWQSGLLDVVRANLLAIAREDLFDILLKRLMKFTVAKLDSAAGGRAVDQALPTDLEIHGELQRRRIDQEPYADFVVRAGLDELSEGEQDAFSEQLRDDEHLHETVDALVQTADPAAAAGARALAPDLAADPSLLSPDVLDQLQQEYEQTHAPGQRGLVSSAFVAKKALSALIRVVRRFVTKRDHGIYPTVVEELLREFYLANVGARVWSAMKQQTKSSFDAADVPGGGNYFASKLCERMRAGDRPRITLVGHSTGAVFINNFLEHVQSQPSAGNLTPLRWAIENVLLLAPACTFADFSRFVDLPFFGSDAGLVKRLRIYAMSDEMECADVLVPGVYTRSLLYFVSGVLETNGTGETLADTPLLGMRRYFTQTGVYRDAAVVRVRDVVGADAARSVCSPTENAAPGLGSSARRHGDFDDDALTLESLRYVIAEEA
jgi:hypothetical protein